MTFEEYARPGTCEVCGANGLTVVCCSSLGAVSHAYCYDCWNDGLEPYGTMVGCVSGCGDSIDDVNESAQDIIRRSLSKIGKSVEEFNEAVAQANRTMEEFFASWSDCGHDLEDLIEEEF